MRFIFRALLPAAVLLALAACDTPPLRAAESVPVKIVLAELTLPPERIEAEYFVRPVMREVITKRDVWITDRYGRSYVVEVQETKLEPTDEEIWKPLPAEAYRWDPEHCEVRFYPDRLPRQYVRVKARHFHQSYWLDTRKKGPHELTLSLRVKPPKWADPGQKIDVELLKRWRLVRPSDYGRDGLWAGPLLPDGGDPGKGTYYFAVPGYLPLPARVTNGRIVLCDPERPGKMLPAEALPATVLRPARLRAAVTAEAPGGFDPAAPRAPRGRVTIGLDGDPLGEAAPGGEVALADLYRALLKRKRPLDDLTAEQVKVEFARAAGEEVFFGPAATAKLAAAEAQPVAASTALPVRVPALARALVLRRPEWAAEWPGTPRLQVRDAGGNWSEVRVETAAQARAARWDADKDGLTFLPAALGRERLPANVRVVPGGEFGEVVAPLDCKSLDVPLLGWRLHLPDGLDPKEVRVRVSTPGKADLESVRPRRPGTGPAFVPFPGREAGAWKAWERARIEVRVPDRLPIFLPAPGRAAIDVPRPKSCGKLPYLLLVNDMGPVQAATRLADNRVRQCQADVCREVLRQVRDLQRDGKPAVEIKTVAVVGAGEGNWAKGERRSPSLGALLDTGKDVPLPDGPGRHRNPPEALAEQLRALLEDADGGGLSPRLRVLVVTPYRSRGEAPPDLAWLRKAQKAAAEEGDKYGELRVVTLVVGAPGYVKDADLAETLPGARGLKLPEDEGLRERIKEAVGEALKELGKRAGR